MARAYRRLTEQVAVGSAVGWQRWRRQLLQQNRDKGIVLAEGHYGIFQVAESSLLVGVTLHEVPPGIGTRQEVLERYGLVGHG